MMPAAQARPELNIIVGSGRYATKGFVNLVNSIF
jgi:hypothetical protein